MSKISLTIPYTELEQESFLEKWNEMVLAKAEAAKTQELDNKVKGFYVSSFVVAKGNQQDEGVL